MTKSMTSYYSLYGDQFGDQIL